MKLIIESTPTTTTIDGVPVRLWRGRTEGGNPVEVFVHRVGSDDPAAQAELEAVLRETPQPAELRRIRSERPLELRPILRGD